MEKPTLFAMSNKKPVAEVVEHIRSEFERSLRELDIGQDPALLYEPARYILSSGGKRLRPTLLLLTTKSLGVTLPAAMPAALSVEIFHNFTLVHDDIMDHAETRRGRKTVHTKWDEATAILSGDYLMALSYELLSALPTKVLPDVLRVYHKMVRHLCEGQARDKSFETRIDVSLEEYFDMIQGKTGALIQAAFEIGAVIGGASEKDQKQFALLGAHIGRAFQIQDDLLDLIAENHKWGKKVGGDLIEGKKAYLLLRALSMATGEKLRFFQTIVKNQGLNEEQIPLARRYMEECGVIEDAKQAVLGHTEEAMICLDVLPTGDCKEAIRWLLLRMQQRAH